MLFQYKDSRWAVDICNNENVTQNVKGYYKLSSAAAVVLQKYFGWGGTKSEVLTFEIAPHSRKAGLV